MNTHASPLAGMTIDVVIPVLDPGAAGAHTMALAEVLAAAGATAEVFADEVRPRYAGQARSLDEQEQTLTARRPDLIVYQSAIGADAGDHVVRLGVPVVVNDHNLTPPHYFAPYEPWIADGLVRGLAQLRIFGREAAGAVCASAFNASGCIAAGIDRTLVAPVLFTPLTNDPDAGVTERLRGDGASTWLFVGRICPNKAQHDVVTALAAYRHAFDPTARLVLVGGVTSPGYERALVAHISRLGLRDAVTLTGAVDDETLAAHFAAADVFVSLSEHEGFCVPIVEAWHHGLPVVAFATAAVPETVGGAGLLLANKTSPGFVAAAVARVVDDPSLAARLIAAGRDRFATHFAPAPARAANLAAFEQAAGWLRA